MIGRTYTASNSPGLALPTTATTTQSTLLLIPAGPFIVTEFGVTFDSYALQTLITVDLYRTTTLGSPAGAGMPTLTQDSAPAESAASAISASSLYNLTTEPTAVEILRSFYLEPWSGMFTHQFPANREPMASPVGGQGIGIRITTSAAGAFNNVRTWIEWEE